MANEVIKAFQDLTQYLVNENVRLDLKRKEENINLAASQIADRYQKLPADASLKDLQQLQFRSMEDAAKLGALQESLPLINTLYQGTMQNRQLQKAEDQDQALYDVVSKDYSMNAPGLGGDALLKLAQLKKSYEKDIQIKNADGTSSLQRFDKDMKPIGEPITIDAVGFKEELSQYKAKSDIDYNKQANLIKLEYGLKNSSSSGSGDSGAPNYKGFTFLKSQEGPNGELLYEKKGGGVYQLQPDGTLRFYAGKIKPRQSDPKAVKDVLTTVGELDDRYAGLKGGLVGSILETEGGTELFKGLTGFSNTPEKNKTTGYYGIETQTALDQFYKNNSPDKIRKVFDELGQKGYKNFDKLKNYFKAYRHLNEEKKYIQESLFSTAPTSSGIENADKDIIPVETWNRVNETIMQSFGEGAPENTSNALKQAIGNMLGKSPDKVTWDDYTNLDQKKKNKLVRLMDPFIK